MNEKNKKKIIPSFGLKGFVETINCMQGVGQLLVDQEEGEMGLRRRQISFILILFHERNDENNTYRGGTTWFCLIA